MLVAGVDRFNQCGKFFDSAYHVRSSCGKHALFDIGDAGFEFTLLGNYRLRMLLWAGDDEFPPSSQVLYSDNFETGFSAEDRVVAGDILISSIKNNF